jgi:tRNA threonylcarbamoyladenosine biosynthesis protein TsaE
MPLTIAQLGQPVLRRVADAVPPEEIASPPFQAFLAAMCDTLRAAPGVGLAAPQVFVSRRVFLACLTRPDPDREDEPPPIEVFINPVLTPLSAEQEPAWEGCLSFAELLVLVPRYQRVRVDYLDAAGRPRALELEGFPARVVQHEYDHLDGVLTLDRAASTRDIIKASEREAALKDRERPGASQSVDLPDLAATEALGRRLGELLFPGAVVALIGPLGAGKTQLVRAVAVGLGVRDSRLVTSPTFVLIQEYAARLPIYHFDAYRLGGADEFAELGADEYLQGDGVCLIEWADRVASALPAERLTVTLSVAGENARRAEMEAVGGRYGEVLRRLAGAG